MSEFHKLPWDERVKKLGDQAEAVYQVVNPESFKYGLDRPPINISKLPAFIRYTPDMLDAGRAIEVVGIGKDGTLKFKVEKLQALLLWNVHVPVYVFINDSHFGRHATLALKELNRLLHAYGVVDAFHEGKRYWKWKIPNEGSVIWHVR